MIRFLCCTVFIKYVNNFEVSAFLTVSAYMNQDGKKQDLIGNNFGT